jgi:hypothetical protein
MEFRLTSRLGYMLAACALVLLSLGSGARAHSHHGHQHVQQHDSLQAKHSSLPEAHQTRMDTESAGHALHNLGVATHVAARAAADPSGQQCLNCSSDCNCSDACVGACHLVGLGYADVALSYAGGAGVVLFARTVALRPWSTRPRLPPPRV